MNRWKSTKTVKVPIRMQTPVPGYLCKDKYIGFRYNDHNPWTIAHRHSNTFLDPYYLEIAEIYLWDIGLVTVFDGLGNIVIDIPDPYLSAKKQLDGIINKHTKFYMACWKTKERIAIASEAFFSKYWEE